MSGCMDKTVYDRLNTKALLEYEWIFLICKRYQSCLYYLFVRIRTWWQSLNTEYHVRQKNAPRPFLITFHHKESIPTAHSLRPELIPYRSVIDIYYLIMIDLLYWILCGHHLAFCVIWKRQKMEEQGIIMRIIMTTLDYYARWLVLFFPLVGCVDYVWCGNLACCKIEYIHCELF